MPTVNVFGEGEPVYTGQDGEPIADSPPEAISVAQDASELVREGLWRKPDGMAMDELWFVLNTEVADPATGDLLAKCKQMPLVIEISIGGVKVEQPLVCVQIADGKVRLVAKATAAAT